MNSKQKNNKTKSVTGLKKGKDGKLKLRMLMIEDSPTDAMLLQQILEQETLIDFNIIWEKTLSDGFKIIDQGNIDVILLDLNLPDSEESATVTRAFHKAKRIPIIVLTGQDNQEAALHALHAGAQDYLVKGQIDTQLIVRSIRYTIERQKLLNDLEEGREADKRRRNDDFFLRLDKFGATRVTAQTYGLMAISQSAPELFSECVDLYKIMLRQALAQNAYKVEYELSEKLRKMAETIGFLKGGPRDVIEIYTHALRELSANATRSKIQAIMEEGRILVLELMGHLVSFYRNYYLDYRNQM